MRLDISAVISKQFTFARISERSVGFFFLFIFFFLRVDSWTAPRLHWRASDRSVRFPLRWVGTALVFCMPECKLRHISATVADRALFPCTVHRQAGAAPAACVCVCVSAVGARFVEALVCCCYFRWCRETRDGHTLSSTIGFMPSLWNLLQKMGAYARPYRPIWASHGVREVGAETHVGNDAK